MSEKNIAENVVKNWGEMQQKLLTDWLDTLRRFGGAPTIELWRKTVDTWQSAVKETIDAWADWTRQWTETLAKARGTPDELRELAKEGHEELQQWTEAERDLWQGWFNAIREINFRPEPGWSQSANGRGPDTILARQRPQDDRYAGGYGSALDRRCHWDARSRERRAASR